MKIIGLMIEIPDVDWCEKCQEWTFQRKLPKEESKEEEIEIERRKCLVCGHIHEFYVVDMSFPYPDPSSDFWEPDPIIVGLDYIKYTVKEEVQKIGENEKDKRGI